MRSFDVFLELLHVSLELRPSVLEPCDHLCVAETERQSDLVAVRRGEILLVEESLLELKDLVVGERSAGLAFLLGVGGAAVVEQREVVDLDFACEQKDMKVC